MTISGLPISYYPYGHRDDPPSITKHSYVKFTPRDPEIDALSGGPMGVCDLPAPGVPDCMPVGTKINVVFPLGPPPGRMVEHLGVISGPPTVIVSADYRGETHVHICHEAFLDEVR